MFFRILAVPLGVLFVAFPFFHGTPPIAWVAAIMGVVFIAYGIRPRRPVSPVSPAMSAALQGLVDEAALQLSFFQMFTLNFRATRRNSVFMLFSILTAVVIAWYWQFSFDVPRDHQEGAFILVWCGVYLMLVLSRAVVATLLQRNRLRSPPRSDA